VTVTWMNPYGDGGTPPVDPKAQQWDELVAMAQKYFGTPGHEVTVQELAFRLGLNAGAVTVLAPLVSRGIKIMKMGSGPNGEMSGVDSAWVKEAEKELDELKMLKLWTPKY
jgi:hypothetical protein